MKLLELTTNVFEEQRAAESQREPGSEYHTGPKQKKRNNNQRFVLEMVDGLQEGAIMIRYVYAAAGGPLFKF